MDFGEADALWQNAESTRSPTDYAGVLKHLEQMDAAAPCCDTKWRLARACKDCAHASDNKKSKQALLDRGLRYADEGLLEAGGNFKGPLWKGIMLGQCSDHMGIQDKVKGAPQIRDQFAEACRLSPDDAESKHCLGQWMFALADMNWVGRQASKLLGLEGTFEEAIELFLAAENTEPGFYLTNQYMIALCHKKLKQFAESKEWLDRVLASNATSPDELQAHTDAKELFDN